MSLVEREEEIFLQGMGSEAKTRAAVRTAAKETAAVAAERAARVPWANQAADAAGGCAPAVFIGQRGVVVGGGSPHARLRSWGGSEVAMVAVRRSVGGADAGSGGVRYRKL